MSKKAQRKANLNSSPLIEVLEPRFMMSADLPGLDTLIPSDDTQDLNAESQSLIDSAQEHFEQIETDALPAGTETTDETRHEIVFVNEDVADYQQLIDDMQQSDESRTLEVVVLDANSDGLEELSQILSEHNDLDAIHIISHGSDGAFALGGDWIDNSDLLANSESVSNWSSALTEEADILLYGCNVSIDGDGEALTATLAELTGADVAASDDATGHEDLGGDWELEHQSGVIDTEIAISQNSQLQWNGLLDVTTGLVGHWTLNTNGLDSSGNALNGTLGGNAFIDQSAGNLNVGAGNLALDGVDDYLDLSTHAATFDSMTEGTIAGWIKTTDTVNMQTLFGVADQNDFVSFATLGSYQGNLFFSLAEETSSVNAYILDIESTAFIADGNWHHIAVTIDASGNSLYVDGVKIDIANLTYNYGNASTTDFFDNVLNVNSVQIGVTDSRTGYDYDANGSIDEVRVYDRALTEADINELFVEANNDHGTAVVSDGSNTPVFIEWDGNTITGKSPTDALPDNYRTIQGADAPSRDEQIVIGIDASSNVTAEIWDGTNWTSLGILGTVSESYWYGAEVAYEQTSGDAIIVWNDNSQAAGDKLRYAVWDGTSWSAAQSITAFTGAEPQNIRLSFDPGSDEMVLVVSDSSADDYALVWDGDAWGNAVTLDTSGIAESDQSAIAVSYEATTGNAMVTYGKNNDTNLYYQIWNGTTWSAEASIALASGAVGDPSWVYSESDYNSDSIVVGVMTTSNDVWLNVWDGTSWDASFLAGTSTEGTIFPNLDVAFEGSTGQALATYGDTSQNTFMYRTWDSATGWSAELTGPDIGAATNSMTLDSSPTSDQIMLAIQDANSAVHYIAWDGSAWGTVNKLSTSTGEIKNQPFVFIYDQDAPLVDLNNAPTFTVGDGVSTTDINSTNNYGRDITIQDDGKILVAGYVTNGTNDDFTLTRYNADGTLDTSFGTGGIVTTAIGTFNDTGNSVTVQTDGKIIVAGTSYMSTMDFSLVRYNVDGSLDTTFGGDGKVTTDFDGRDDYGYSVTIQNDGKVLVSGISHNGTNFDFALARYNSDGTLDTTFSTDGILKTPVTSGYDSAYSVTVQDDGKILVAGDTYVTDYDMALVRYNSDGSLDTTFSGDGILTTAIGAGFDFGYNVTVQTDGKILLTGMSDNGTDYDFALVRYNVDGTLDTSFSTDGKLTTDFGFGDDTGFDVVVQTDGKILVSGYSNNGTDFDFAVARYNTDGTLDTTFSGDGMLTTPLGSGDDQAYSISLQTDGKILIAGESSNGTNVDIALVRYNSDGTLDTSFDSVYVNTLDGTPTFIEGGAAVVLDSDVQVFDAELSAADEFNGAILTLQRNGGASADDVFSSTGNLSALTEGSKLIVSGVSIAEVSVNSGGILQLTFATNTTQAVVNEVLQSIAYANSSDTPEASVQIDWVFNDGNVTDQGSGGALDVTGSTTVTITSVNDAPVASLASGYGVNEDDGYRPFGVMGISDVDAGSGDLLVTLSVNNGLIKLTTVTGLTFTSGTTNDSASMTFTGTSDDINLALDTFTYRPDANFNGNDTLTLFVDDQGNTGGAALTSTDTANIAVSPINDAPVLAIDAGLTLTAINEDSIINNGNTIADILASAGTDTITDVDAGAVEGIAIFGLSNTNGTWQYDIGSGWIDVGTVSVNSSLLLGATDSLRFVPNADWNGTELFSLAAWDQTSGVAGTKVDTSSYGGTTAYSSGTAIPSITVNAVDDVTTVVDDTTTTNEDTAVNIDVLANDTDVDAKSPVDTVTQGTNGSVVIEIDGTLTYTPDANFTGTDTFTYTNVEGNTATVTVTVSAVNDAPTVVGESYTVVEGVPYTSALGIDDLLLNDSDIEGDTLSVNTTPVSGPANGELVLNADGTFTYTANNNFDGTDSFVYEVIDSNGATAEATVTITVQQREIRILFTTVSDVSNSKVPGVTDWDAGELLAIGDPNLSFEPVGSDGSILPYFDLEGFSASNNMTINGLHFVSNDITVNGVDLMRGDILFVSESADTLTSTNSLAIATGDIIVFRADVVDDFSSGTFIHLFDQPGTAETTGITLVEHDIWIGDVELKAGNFLFTQNSVAEESSIYYYNTVTDTVSTLISSVDIDISYNNFQGIMIVTEDLYLDGTMVPAGSIITTLRGGDELVGDNGIGITTDNMFYLTVTTTTMGATGHTTADATLLFDTGEVGLNNNQKTMQSFSIIEEISTVSNIDPEVILSAPILNYTEGDPATIIDPTIVLTDPDSANFDGGLLRIDLGATGTASDLLSIQHEGTAAGQIGVSVNEVTYGGIVIGTFSGGTNGSEPLIVFFNVNADVDAIQTLLRNITYDNTSINPSENQRSVSFTITDGDGGVNNVVSTSIIVNGVNAAPVLSGANDLTSINEDQINSAGTLISTLTSGWITDSDLGALEGIAVIDVDNTNGRWEYTIDAGLNWTSIGSPSINAALLLAANADTSIRFVPDADWNGTVTDGITFHAWDQTSGLNGDTIAITSSENLRDQFDTVSYSNNDGSAVWTSDWIEFDDNGSASSGNVRVEGGKLHLDNLDGGVKEYLTRSADLSSAVSAVLTFDYDAFGEGGLDIVAFEISNDGGSTWTLMENMDIVGNIAGSKSFNIESYTTLTDQMEVRFNIIQGLGGTTQHINFDNVDIAYTGTSIGGSSSVSTTTASSSITVNAINDAPVAVDNVINVTEDTPFTSTIDLDANDTDVDDAALTVTAGTFTTDQGGTLVLAADGSYTYTASLNFNGVDTVDYTVTDGALTDVGTLTINVSAVNDATVLTNGSNASYTEGGGINPFLSSTLTDIDSTDFDGGVLTFSIASGGDGTDTLRLAIMNGVTVSSNDVFVDGVLVGTKSGGTSGTDYTINLNSNATPTRVESLLHNLMITSTVDNPTIGIRNLEVVITDGDGGTSNTAIASANLTTVLNDDPFNNGTLPTDISVTEDVSSDINISSIDLVDFDDNGGNISVSLATSTGGSLTATGSAGIIIGNNGTSTITINGTVDDINAYLNVSSNIQYLHPTASINGDNVDTIQITVNDLGNTGTGGGTDIDLGTINIDITPINDVPLILTNTGASLFEEGSVVITQAMLEVTDIDNTSAEIVYTMTVDSVHGVIKNSGVALGVGNTFTQADINAGNVTYEDWDWVPALDSFSFTVSDGAGGTIAETSFGLTINNINDAPQGTNTTVTATEDTDYVFSVSDFGFSDTNDSPANNLLNIIIASVPTNGTLYLDINSDGIIDGGEVLSASSVVSIADINADKLKFQPASDVNGVGYDSFTFQVQDDGGVANGGTDTDQSVNTIIIDVTPQNDAPILSDANDLTAIDEDPVSNDGTLVADLISGHVTDPDTGALLGIAVTAVDDTNGTWEYTTDGGSSWTAFGAVDVSVARLLSTDASTLVRFVPDADWNGTVTDGITFYAWDQTTGVAGGTADLSESALDDFSSSSYSGGSGWDTDWTSSGNISIIGEELVVNASTSGSIYRQIDLSNASTATLSFEYTAAFTSPKSIVLEISNDGGSSFTTLEIFNSSSGSGLFTADISTYIASDTQIGFRVTSTAGAPAGTLSVDNVQIQYNSTDKVGGNTAFSTLSTSSSITVNAVDDITTVVNDTATTNEDAAVNIDVLANDTDLDTKSPVASVTQGTNGSVIIESDGTLTYTPNANFNGTDTFTYTNVEGNTGTVTVTVNAVDDITTVVNDTATTNEDAAVNIDVLANDTDLDTKSPVASVTQGTNGSVIIESDGTLTYTPNANFNGTDTFTYTNVEGNTGTVTVTVNAVDDITTVVNDTATTNEDAAVNIDVLANDTDLDTKSPVASVTQGTNGSVIIESDGTLTYTPNANFNGTDTFTYTNVEGNTGTVTVTVNAVDDITTVVNDTATTNEDAAVNIDVLANDTDLDTKSPVASVTQGTNGSVIIESDGTLTYTPNANFNGTDTFTYTNVEGNTGTVTVTVNAVDDITTVVNDTATTNEDAAVNIDVLANDTDLDTKSPVASVTQGTNGSVIIESDGTLTYTPNANFNGTDTFTYTNVEGNTGTVTVTVNAVDDITTVVNDTATTNEDAAVNIDVLANDTDLDTKSPVASVTQGTNGSVIIESDGTLTYTPNANFNGTDTFTYTNVEGNTGTVTVTVNAVDDITTVVNDTATTNEDAAVNIDVLANDTDLDTKSPVASVTQGTNGSVIIESDGTLTYTPNANFNGTDTFTYTNVEGNTGTVTVTVNAVDDITTVVNDTATTNEDAAVNIDVLANDTDLDTKSPVASVTQGTNGSVIIESDGTLTYTPNANFNGTDTFTYTNVEGNTGTVTVTVNAVDDITTVVNDTATTNEDAAVNIDVLANDTDLDTKSPVASVTQGTNGSVIIESDGTLTYTPNANFNGTDTFTYTNVEGNTGTVTVTVNAVDDITTVVNDTATTNEDAAVNIDVLANDTDLDTKSPVASVTQGTNGSVIIESDGTLTYTPNANFNGTDTFTYTNVEGNTGTVTVTVNAVDDITTVVNDTATTNEDAAVNIDVLANDTDLDTKSPVASVTQGTNGSVIIESDGTLTYTPNANFNGTDTFTYTNVEGNTGTVTVTVNAVDDITTVVNDTATTNEDAAVNIDVLANDTDLDTKSPVASVTQGTNGSVIIESDGTLTYTPNANFNGTDTFTYTNVEGNTGTVTVTVNAVDDITTVVNDTATTNEDAAVNIDVLANDTDLDTKSPVASVTQGTNGSVIIESDGTLTYTPNANFNGTDTFTYTNVEGNTGTVTVTVNAVDDITTVVNDTATTNEDAAVNIDVLANDTDLDTKSPVASVTQGTNGSVIIESDGTLTYTPNANFNGTDTFTYTNVEGNTGTVTVTVNAVDDITTVVNDTATTNEDAAVNIDVLANDTDLDTKSPVASVTQGTNGSVIIESDGTLTYTPNANFNGTDTFTYTNVEGNTGTVTVTVNAVDDITTVVNDTATTNEDAAVNIDVLANDTDLDTKSPVASVTQGTNGSVIIESDGTLTYTPNANFNGTDTFTYTNVEGNTGTVTVTVNAVDDITTVVNDTATTNEDAAVNIDVLANDTDLDTKSPVASVTQGTNGSVIIESDGTLTYTPNANFNGTDTFTYTNVEGNTGTVTVTVNAVDDITTVVNDTATTNEDAAVNIDVLANDTDLDTKSPVASVTQGTNGSVIIESDGTLTYTPNANFNGTDTFTYTNVEGNTGTVTVTVNAVDDITTVVNDTATTNEDAAVNIDVLANDTDLDTKSPVASVTQGTNGSVIIESDGTLTYTPNANFNGTDTFTYTNVEGNTGTVTVTVNAVDDITTVVNDTATTNEDAAVNIDVLANDTDLDTKSPVASVTQGTNGSVIIESDGTLTYTPNANFNGTDTFTYTNVEGNTGTVTVTVNAVDDITTVVNDTATTNEDAAVNIDVLANDTDLDTKSPVASVTQGTNGSVIIESDGTLTYTPNANFNGTDTFTYTNVEGNTGTVTVTVNAVDDITTVVNDTATTNEDAAVNIDVLANDTDLDTKSPVASVTQGTNGSVIIESDGTLTYTPNANFNGTDTFTYTNVEGNTGTVTVTVNAVDDITTVVNDTATTNEDAAVNIDVLANDTDLDTKSPVASVTQGTNGSVIIESDGTLTYTPNANFNGTDTFTYTNVEGNTGTVTVTVNAVDDITTVVNDTATTNEDAAVNIDVLANDTDLDTKSPVASVTQGTNGSVIIESDGTLTYTPNANFNGTDTFTYTNVEGNTGTVTVTVNAVDDITTVVNDTATTNEDAAVNIDVLANDTDLDTKSPVASVTQGTNGSVIIESDGTLTYTPNANFNGTDTFTYTNVEGNTGTVTVTVNAVDDITTVVNDTATTNEDAAVNIDVLANDTDLDTKSPVASVTQGTNGSVIIESDGTLTYTPNANFNGTDTFTYTNVEGNTGTVTVTVNAVDDITTVVNDTATTNEDAAVNIDVLANDTDLDTKSPVASVTQGTNGSVIIESDGTLTYTPNANFNGTDTFTYTNVEGNTGTVTVTVNAVDDITTVVNDTATTNEDAAVNIDVLANDTDLDTKSPVASVTQGTNGSVIIESDGTLTYTPNANFNGTDTFTYTNVEGNTGTVTVTVNAVDDITTVVNDTATTNEDAAVNIDVLANDTDLDTKSPVASVTQGTNGSVIIESDGTLTYTPNANFNGTDTFTYTNVEGNTGTVTVTVNAVDDITTVVNDTATTNEDAAVNIDVLANDTDLDTKSPVASVTQGTNGSVIIESDGTLTYTPNANFNGTDTFTYTNVEGNTGTVTVTVNAVDDITTVVNDTATTNEDAAVNIDVLANDTDIDGNAATLVSATDGLTGTTSVNTTTGVVTYTPNLDFNGTDTFTYTNSEGNTETVTVTVNAVNDAPIAVDDPLFSTDKNIPISNINVLDNDIDPDGDTLNIITASAIQGTVTINTDGTLNYIPNTNYYGMDTVTYQISDGEGGTDSQTFLIEVVGTTILPGNGDNDTTDTSTDDDEQDESIQEEVNKELNQDYDVPDILTDNLVDDREEEENDEERVLIDVLESIDIDSLEYVLNIQDPSVDSSDLEKPDSSMAQQLLSLEPIQMDSLIFDSISDSTLSKNLHLDLEKMYEDIDEAFEEQKHKNEFTVEVATGISVSLTAGFVAWLLRSGTLIASLFATMPMWRNFDPVSILSESEEEEETSDESNLDNIEQQSSQDQETEHIFDKEK